jgi:hypothetical protein
MPLSIEALHEVRAALSHSTPLLHASDRSSPLRSASVGQSTVELAARAELRHARRHHRSLSPTSSSLRPLSSNAAESFSPPWLYSSRHLASCAWETRASPPTEAEPHRRCVAFPRVAGSLLPLGEAAARAPLPPTFSQVAEAKKSALAERHSLRPCRCRRSVKHQGLPIFLCTRAPHDEC